MRHITHAINVLRHDDQSSALHQTQTGVRRQIAGRQKIIDTLVERSAGFHSQQHRCAVQFIRRVFGPLQDVQLQIGQPVFHALFQNLLVQMATEQNLLHHHTISTFNLNSI